jgi:hypothetical protein
MWAKETKFITGVFKNSNLKNLIYNHKILQENHCPKIKIMIIQTNLKNVAYIN